MDRNQYASVGAASSQITATASTLQVLSDSCIVQLEADQRVKRKRLDEVREKVTKVVRRVKR